MSCSEARRAAGKEDEKMKLSVIIPVFNEKDTVVRVAMEVLTTPLPGQIDREVIVVDDGSTDTTRESLNALRSNPAVKVFSLDKNQGKTFAVMHGIAQSTGEIILIQDADLEYSPKDYYALLEHMLAGAGIIYGSRFMGSIRGMTLTNRIANRISTLTINLLYRASLTDIHTCMKIFRREVLDKVTICSRSFGFDTEFTCKILKAGYSIVERPIAYIARSKKDGKKITWLAAINAYALLFYIRFNMELCPRYPITDERLEADRLEGGIPDGS